MFSASKSFALLCYRTNQHQYKKLVLGGGSMVMISSSCIVNVKKRALLCEESRNNNMVYGITNENGDWGLVSKTQAKRSVKSNETLPIMSLEEVEKHVSLKSLYVIYDGIVYDITKFVEEHPGGSEALLGAAGQDIHEFWEKYMIHYNKDALSVLEQYKVARLSNQDAELAKQKSALRKNPNTGEEAPSVTRARIRGYKHFIKLASVAVIWPTCEIVRISFKVLGYLGAWSLLNFVSSYLPFSVPGFAKASKIARNNNQGKKPRIAVVGGGISGVGAAFALRKSGEYDVVIYEARSQLGGNAQTSTFTTEKGNKITQDLSVLFWAPEYYKNYVALLHETKANVVDTQVAYLLHTNMLGTPMYYTPPGTEMFQKMQPSLYEKYKKDFDRYDRMIWICRMTNNLFTMDTSPSFYKHTGIWPMFNPINFIPLRAMAWMCGISNEFYVNVLRPFQGWNFSTADIDNLPAVALPVLDDIVSLTATRRHKSWGAGNSTQVFERAAQGCEIKLDTRVRKVYPGKGKNGGILIVDDKGSCEEYDRVILACPAVMAANILQDKNYLEKTLLEGVEYHDDWKNPDAFHWLEAAVHTDDSIIPNTSGLREYIKKNFAFVVDVDKRYFDNGSFGGRYDEILGSWSPAAIALGEKGTSMFMTQAPRGNENLDPSKILRTFSPPRSHPTLGVRNMMITQFLCLIQGRRGVYYVGNYVSAGNGHDLSLVTGLCVARAIGADYPWPENKEAYRDVLLMSRFMGV